MGWGHDEKSPILTYPPRTAFSQHISPWLLPYIVAALQPDQESMATNDARVDEGVAECDVHAQVLGAVHQEFVDFGLVPQQQQQHPRLLTQSPAGAFPPLRYGDGDVGGGRVVAVRALAMFDDLIVNATATSPRAASNEDGDLGDGEVRRRIKLNVSTWSSLFSPGEAKPANAGGEEQEEERVEGAGDRGGSERFHQPRHQVRVCFFHTYVQVSHACRRREEPAQNRRRVRACLLYARVCLW